MAESRIERLCVLLAACVTSLNSLIIAAQIYFEKLCAYILVGIGACRAVWVPGQDLAMPHLMRNCGKRTHFVTTLYAIRTSVRA